MRFVVLCASISFSRKVVCPILCIRFNQWAVGIAVWATVGVGFVVLSGSLLFIRSVVLAKLFIRLTRGMERGRGLMALAVLRFMLRVLRHQYF